MPRGLRTELPKTIIGKVLRRILVEEERQRQLAEPAHTPNIAPSAAETEICEQNVSASDAQEVAR